MTNLSKRSVILSQFICKTHFKTFNLLNIYSEKPVSAQKVVKFHNFVSAHILYTLNHVLTVSVSSKLQIDKSEGLYHLEPWNDSWYFVFRLVSKIIQISCLSLLTVSSKSMMNPRTTFDKYRDDLPSSFLVMIWGKNDRI